MNVVVAAAIGKLLITFSRLLLAERANLHIQRPRREFEFLMGVLFSD